MCPGSDQEVHQSLPLVQHLKGEGRSKRRFAWEDVGWVEGLEGKGEDEREGGAEGRQ